MVSHHSYDDNQDFILVQLDYGVMGRRHWQVSKAPNGPVFSYKLSGLR